MLLYKTFCFKFVSADITERLLFKQGNSNFKHQIKIRWKSDPTPRR